MGTEGFRGRYQEGRDELSECEETEWIWAVLHRFEMVQEKSRYEKRRRSYSSRHGGINFNSGYTVGEGEGTRFPGSQMNYGDGPI